MSAEDAQARLRQLFEEIPAEEKPATTAVSIAGGIHIGSISGGSQVLVGHWNNGHGSILRPICRFCLRHDVMQEP